MLLLVVVIAIPMAWKVNRARNQRIVVAELEKLNAEIYYDYQSVPTARGRAILQPPGPNWLIDLFGKEYFVEVVKVAVDNPHVNSETIALISRLPEITEVDFGSNTRITDSGLANLVGMDNLKRVCLDSDRITGAGLIHLNGLKRFSELWASGWITDASLEHISKLERLEVLNIAEAAQITDRGLAQIAKLTNLRYLVIDSSSWEDYGKRDYMKVTEEGLAHLYGLKSLETLSISGIRGTQAGIDKLRKALPHCGDVRWNVKGEYDADAIDGDDVSAHLPED